MTEFGEGYHGFWTNDITQLNAHFGTGDTLTALVNEVHKRGMYIMVDVVVNNVAVAGNASLIDYTKIPAPFNDKKYFHPAKPIADFSDQLQVQNNWLATERVSLADLDTSQQYVMDTWHNWVSNLVTTYNCMLRRTV